MRFTIPYIEKKFEEFNQQMFADKLPKPVFELSNAKTFLGLCVSQKRELANGYIELYNFRLRFNTRIDLEEELMEDIIIHEMIHYFIGFNKLEDTSTHGVVFKHIMNNINEKYGRHLNISHKVSSIEQEQYTSNKRIWHVVAIVQFNNGNIGIKVLPRIEPKIIDFCKILDKEKNIIEYSLYLTDEPYFNNFPNSTALRINIVDKDIVSKHITKAKRLKISNGKIINK